MIGNRKVRIKELANYLGVHRNTAREYYKTFMVMAETKHNYLSVKDLANIEDVETSQMLEMLKVIN